MVTRIFFTKLVLALLIGMNSHADAQIFDRYGIEVGPSGSNMLIYPGAGERWDIYRDNINARFDMSVYGFAERDLNSYLTLTAGLGRTIKGFNSSIDTYPALRYGTKYIDGDAHRVTGAGHNVNVRMTYLSAPVKLRLERPGGTVRPFLAGGPRVDVQLRRFIEGRHSENFQELMDSNRRFMLGVTVEAGFLLDIFETHRLSISGRFNEDLFYSAETSLGGQRQSIDYRTLNTHAELVFGMTLNLD